jgi:hypothetical protein
MHARSYANAPGYALIIIGLVLSLISAFVPHFDAGYRLATGVLFAGLIPYMVYGAAVPLLRSGLTTITGLVIVVLHTWLVLNQRIIGHADYSDGLIYYGPMLLALFTLPLVVIAIKKTGYIEGTSH